MYRSGWRTAVWYLGADSLRGASLSCRCGRIRPSALCNSHTCVRERAIRRAEVAGGHNEMLWRLSNRPVQVDKTRCIHSFVVR